MLRSTQARSLLRSVGKLPIARSSYSAASGKLRNVASIQQLSGRRPQAIQALTRPTTTSLLYATKTPFDPITKAEDAEVAKHILESHPNDVSASSSVRQVFEKSPGEAAKVTKDDEMLAGVKADLVTIKETFSLEEVPKETLYLGLAGLLPYAATSLSTVWLSYDINHAHATGSGIIFSPETAHQLLDLVTPIQIGFGAVIISFLGAIHWGLEYAGYGGYHGYRRYMIGVAAPAIAWPTIYMPVEYALITQFFAFNFMYFADARATVRGWFPPWYSTYRFVLTFIVGASIVASLVGRGQIVRSDSRLKSAVDYIKEDRDSQWEALEREEKERRLTAAADEEDEEEGEEEEEEEEEESEDDSDDSKKSKDGDDKADAEKKEGDNKKDAKKDGDDKDSKKDSKKDGDDKKDKKAEKK